ncbi:MAG: hypothetical protein ACRDH2_12040 [Anaerolineales bacterium]
MNRRIVLGILLALVLIAGAAGIGLTAYQAGLAQGIAQDVRITVPEGGNVPAGALPYWAYGGPFFWGRPFGFGFGCLGFLFPLLFFFLIFGLLRGLFWRGPWGGRRGWGEQGPRGQGVPPMFEEWHKRAHGQGTEPGQEPPAQST